MARPRLIHYFVMTFWLSLSLIAFPARNTDVENEQSNANATEIRVAKDTLLERWQDWILSSSISVNHFNCLMVLASKSDFALVIPLGYSLKYVQNSASFRMTMSQLASQIRGALTHTREDINRVQNGMERVPNQLKTIVLYLKHAPIELITSIFPDTFETTEKLVNNSLIVLRRPEKQFEQVSNFLTELDYLLSSTTTDAALQTQLKDVKTQWQSLTELIIALANRAEKMRESLLLQLNWILDEFLQLHLVITESYRDFTIQLLLHKIIEIDYTCDLLGVISRLYTDISSKFIDDDIGSYGHLLLLTNEVDRRQYLMDFRLKLPNQAVYIARNALKEQEEFYQREKVRKKNFERFLNETSLDDLIGLMG